MKITLVYFASLFSLCVAVSVFAEKSSAERFQEALQYGNSVRGTAQKEAVKFETQKVFKNQKGGYTENPPQTGYYQGSTQSDTHTMEIMAQEEITKDEVDLNSKGEPIATPGKTVAMGFSKRPVFKINPDADYMKKSSLITDNAQSVITGVSNKHIDCENSKTTACQTEYVEKTCNEEVRSIQRVCEKIPAVTVSEKELVYPACRSMVITQGEYAGCPAGYGFILYSDMVRHQYWDDVRLCAKTVVAGESRECFGGYLVAGLNGDSSTERAVVPKKMHGRIRFSNVLLPMKITIINETTGQTLYNQGRFSNGQVIELPYSEDKDQTFRFYKAASEGMWDPTGTGVMVVYFDHSYKDKVADVVWSDEVQCRDI